MIPAPARASGGRPRPPRLCPPALPGRHGVAPARAIRARAAGGRGTLAVATLVLAAPLPLAVGFLLRTLTAETSGDLLSAAVGIPRSPNRVETGPSFMHAFSASVGSSQWSITTRPKA